MAVFTPMAVSVNAPSAGRTVAGLGETRISWVARQPLDLAEQMLPPTHRAARRREWQAELSAARAQGRSPVALAAGAIPDA